MGWSQKFLSKAMLDKRGSATYATPRSDAVDLAVGSSLLRSDAGPFHLGFCRGGYQAQDPFSDTTLLEVDDSHAFAVVLNADFTARGASYLSRNLAREIRSQVQAAKGDLSLAFLTAISVMDRAFRRIHPFNGPVLEGVRIAAAYIDTTTNTLHLASNGGGARAVAGSSLPDGRVTIKGSIGADLPASADPSACTVQRLKLGPNINTVVIGSPGLWREMSPDSALLRVQHHCGMVPAANGGNAAAHLINFALHRVAQRLRSSRDPRMRSLREVTHLQSLWMGDKTNFKSSHRQPLRRRRGDVHGDLSAAVLRLQWHGHSDGEPLPCKLRHSMSTPTVSNCPQQRPSAAAHWRHLRMHLLDYPKAARQLVQCKWQQVVQAAVDQAQQRQRQVASAKPSRKGPEQIAIRASSRDLDGHGNNFVSVSA